MTKYQTPSRRDVTTNVTRTSLAEAREGFAQDMVKAGLIPPGCGCPQLDGILAGVVCRNGHDQRNIGLWRLSVKRNMGPALAAARAHAEGKA